MQSFNHKRIVKFYNTYVYEQRIYTVMEYAKGGELESLLAEKGALSEVDAKLYFEQIHDAVSYIHSKNVIHRDLKPANLLFKDEDKKEIVLIDFGISGLSSGNIHEKVNAGTIRYIAPELVDGNFDSDTRLDIWSLGVILYRMLFEQFPFEDKDEGKLMSKICNQELEFPAEIKVSKAAKKLITGMLEKSRKNRISASDQLFESWFEDKFADK